ncbi:MAG: hypothetical protein ACR2KJ_04090 [Jatrophihabitans sp.]
MHDAGQIAAAEPTAVGALSAREVALANAGAHDEANRTLPIIDGQVRGTPTTGTAWPANVHSVSYGTSTRADAMTYIDGSTGYGKQPVVVIRMVGTFALTHAGPSGSQPHTAGTVLTMLMDSASGRLLDMGIDDPKQAEQIYGAVEVYHS